MEPSERETTCSPRADALRRHRPAIGQLRQSAIWLIGQDVNRLAHKSLITEAPQTLELASGRHIGLSLVETVNTGLSSSAEPTTSCPPGFPRTGPERSSSGNGAPKQAAHRRRSTPPADRHRGTRQLATWVAGDAGLYAEATKYTEYGLLAAQAAGNAPLAGNVISTFSYQLANTKDPQRAGVLPGRPTRVPVVTPPPRQGLCFLNGSPGQTRSRAICPAANRPSERSKKRSASPSPRTIPIGSIGSTRKKSTSWRGGATPN